MVSDIESFLGQLGYEIGTKGSTYFSILLEEVICLMTEGKKGKEIRQELREITKDYCYKYFKTTRSDYYDEMKKFIKNKHNPKQQKVTAETVDTSLIILARKYLKNQEKEKGTQKVYRKKS